MTLKDDILASIEAELAVLKGEEAAPTPAPVAVQPIPTPAPAVEDDSNVPPVIRLAREEARRLQGK